MKRNKYRLQLYLNIVLFQDVLSSPTSAPSSSRKATQREGIQGMSTCNPHAEDEVNNFYHSITSLCAKIYM